MSDEEKKALERIDYIQDFIIENGQYNADVNDMEYFSKVLNLIEKQQKKIEGNKKYIVQLTDEQYRKLVDIIRSEISKEWKDKIKAKIEEVQNMKAKAKDIAFKSSLNYIETELQSLLEKK